VGVDAVDAHTDELNAAAVERGFLWSSWLPLSAQGVKSAGVRRGRPTCPCSPLSLIGHFFHLEFSWRGLELRRLVEAGQRGLVRGDVAVHGVSPRWTHRQYRAEKTASTVVRSRPWLAGGTAVPACSSSASPEPRDLAEDHDGPASCGESVTRTIFLGAVGPVDAPFHGTAGLKSYAFLIGDLPRLCAARGGPQEARWPHGHRNDKVIRHTHPSAPAGSFGYGPRRP